MFNTSDNIYWEKIEVDDTLSNIEYIKEQYPSIDSIEKIVAGLSYEIKQLNTFKIILNILRNNYWAKYYLMKM